MSKIHPVKFFVEEIIWSEIENFLSKAHYQQVYNDLIGFDEELCSVLNDLKLRKIEYDEWQDDVRVLYPKTYISEDFKRESASVFNEILTESNRVHKIRRRIHVELGLINAYELN